VAEPDIEKRDRRQLGDDNDDEWHQQLESMLDVSRLCRDTRESR
jgi:hypothetical protein